MSYKEQLWSNGSLDNRLGIIREQYKLIGKVSCSIKATTDKTLPMNLPYDFFWI